MNVWSGRGYWCLDVPSASERMIPSKGKQCLVLISLKSSD